MAISKGVVVVSLGERRDLVRSIISDIKQYVSLPIVVVSDVLQDYASDRQITTMVVEHASLQWLDSPRWGVRNCNVLSAKFALGLPFDSVCVLNDDMRIASPGFVDGFALAARFGVCVPMNPRVYVKYNAMGADASPHDVRVDGPEYAPACNVSPMFVCRHHDSATTLLTAYLNELQTCMRGTQAFWRASWQTGITPMYLPEQWCVCGSNAKYIRDYKKTLKGKRMSIESMMLHWGQPEVREAFKRG